MSNNIFVVSDNHFGHAATFNKFKLPDGSPMRTFSCVEEMDQHMVDRWNAVVRPQDKVYHLGDVAMKRKDIATVGRCNGHKRLVRGNHDTYATKDYLKYFEEIYGTRLIDHLLLSHIPVHPASLRYNWVNVHGHVHNNVPQGHFGTRYYNVSVEVMDYTPISIEDLKKRLPVIA